MNHFFLFNTDEWFILMEINVHMNRVNAHDVHETIVKQDDHPVQPCWRKCGNHTNKSSLNNWFHCSKRWQVSIVLPDVCLEVSSPKQFQTVVLKWYDEAWERWCAWRSVNSRSCSNVAHKHIWHMNTACITGMFAYW